MMAASKTVVSLSPWTDAGSEQWVQLQSALLVDGATAAGLTLHMQCRKDRPDESFTIQLLAETKLKPRPFARVDWRGSHHSNSHTWARDRGLGPAGRDHFHDPMLHQHLADPMDFMLENIPVATPLSGGHNDLMTLLDHSGNLLNIDNLTDVVSPPWQPPTSFL